MVVQNNTRLGQGDDFIRLQDLLYLCVKHWRWFVLSLVATFGVATFYLLKTPPVYTRTAELLVKRDSRGRSISSDIEGFENFGLVRSNTNVNNEMIALQSPAVMTEVVKRLHLDMNYYMPGKFYDKVLYGTALPFKVKIASLQENETVRFTVNIHKDGSVTLSDFIGKGEPIKEVSLVKGKLPGTMETPLGEITLDVMPGYSQGEEYEVRVVRSGLYGTVNSYASRFSVALNDEESTVLSLSYRDVSITRAEDILNTIIAVYNENWVNDKNQIAVSTSMFINDRLAVIENELGNVDENISSYKSEHLLPDVQAASNMYMAQSSQTSAQILALNTQLSMARYIRNYLATATSRNQLIPANSGLESAGIEKQITEYNTMQLQRNNLVSNSSEQNPLVADIDHSLATMRGAILSSIENLEVTLNTRIRDLQRSEQQTTARIAANPTQAKYLLSVERQQKVKEALYLFLLQKREENELSQAFTAYNTRVVTPPTGSINPTSPVRKNIMLVAFALGLLIPTVFIFVRENMNTKVRGRKDLEKLSLPFVGEIPLYPSTKKRLFGKPLPETGIVVVKEGCRDIINEAFRVLRTNLEFMSDKGEKSNVVIITSFNPGSGKSFLTMNMAVSLAIKNKKVLVIDGDMRHASISLYMNSPQKGLSDFLNGSIEKISDIIVTDKKHEYLHVLPVGTIPPNPTELLFNKRLKLVIDSARNEYDYVFIDCPPIDLVADTLIIEKLADRTIFVIRAGLLERSMLAELENIYTEKKYKNMSLILNGTVASGGYNGYKYGYRYGYGAGYHYSIDGK
ncbi:polysaccharide biosynthesis tyrosine autokinase [uncultured Parabacteroides sp.]|uniref:GumC family protein n=1 Tax=uncultured Parabacteroides sp. TaxID=512312 RepID=UPI0026282255|nr:polysaccharide biosynthesis tyrosine autokinase [uncultured Parabacteroides sp.]